MALLNTLITLVIINNDIFFHLRTSHNTKFINSYRGFLYIIALYYVSDILWGVFWNKQFYSPLYVDTEFYFILMAAGIMYLSKYTVDYLEEKMMIG